MLILGNIKPSALFPYQYFAMYFSYIVLFSVFTDWLALKLVPMVANFFNLLTNILLLNNIRKFTWANKMTKKSEEGQNWLQHSKRKAMSCPYGMWGYPLRHLRILSPNPKCNKQDLGQRIFCLLENIRNLKGYKTIKELVIQEPFFTEVSMAVCFSGRNNSQYKHSMKTTFIYITKLIHTLEPGTYLLKRSIAESLEIKPLS